MVLHNGELGKISKEQRAGEWPVWETDLRNPNFAEYAELCGALGIRVASAEDTRRRCMQAGDRARRPGAGRSNDRRGTGVAMNGNRFSAEAYRRARERSHAAAQWPSRAARANLAPQPDDSHSNLGWEADLAALAGWPLDASGHRLAVSFEPLELLWLAGNDIVARLPLAKASEAAVGTWCDQRLIDAGLQSASTAAMPYELSYSLDTAGSADAAVADLAAPLKRLGAAFGNAYAWLEKLVASYGHRAIVNPRVRCWPHHFDLAMLFVLEAGDPETAPLGRSGAVARRRQLCGTLFLLHALARAPEAAGAASADALAYQRVYFDGVSGDRH